MEFFKERIDKDILVTLNNIIDNAFIRITYTEAVEILKTADKKFDFVPNLGCWFTNRTWTIFNRREV